MFPHQSEQHGSLRFDASIAKTARTIEANKFDIEHSLIHRIAEALLYLYQTHFNTANLPDDQKFELFVAFHLLPQVRLSWPQSHAARLAERVPTEGILHCMNGILHACGLSNPAPTVCEDRRVGQTPSEMGLTTFLDFVVHGEPVTGEERPVTTTEISSTAVQVLHSEGVAPLLKLIQLYQETRIPIPTVSSDTSGDWQAILAKAEMLLVPADGLGQGFPSRQEPQTPSVVSRSSSGQFAPADHVVHLRAEDPHAHITTLEFAQHLRNYMDCYSKTPDQMSESCRVILGRAGVRRSLQKKRANWDVIPVRGDVVGGGASAGPPATPTATRGQEFSLEELIEQMRKPELMANERSMNWSLLSLIGTDEKAVEFWHLVNGLAVQREKKFAVSVGRPAATQKTDEDVVDLFRPKTIPLPDSMPGKITTQQRQQPSSGGRAPPRPDASSSEDEGSTSPAAKSGGAQLQDQSPVAPEMMPVANMRETDIARWTRSWQKRWTTGELKLDDNLPLTKQSFFRELVLVVNQAHKLARGYYVRDTQLIAIVVSLHTELGIGKQEPRRFVNIYTGEGKSVIMGCLAAMQALIMPHNGEMTRVDIIISSTVLAKQSLQEMGDFFDVGSPISCRDCLARTVPAGDGETNFR